MSKVKASISLKLILVSTMLLLAVVTLSGVLNSVQTGKVIDDLGGQLNTKTVQSLRNVGIARLELLIQLVKLELLQHDYNSLQTIVDTVANNDERITDVAVVGKRGIILAHTDKQQVGKPASGPLRKDMNATNLQVHDEISLAKGKAAVMAFTSPVEHEGERLGSILVAAPLTRLRAEVEQVKDVRKRAARMNIWTTLIVAFISALVGLVLAVVQGLRLSQPIKKLADQADSFARGALDTRVQIGSQDEIGLLGDRFNYMAEQVQTLMRESVEKAAMEKEIEVASEIQATIVPDASSIVDLRGISLASYFKPATKCGGDWWTFYPLPHDKVLVLIGDVTGHGVGSAMITAAAKGATSCLMATTPDSLQLDEMFKALNSALLDTGRGRFVMSCFAAIFDPKERTLHAVNAGHNFPYHLDDETGRLVSLVVQGNKLGDLPDSEYETRTFQLKKNDTVIWYTDGITECVNDKNEEYGERRLRSLLREHASDRPDELRDTVVKLTRQYYGGVPQKDDITFVVGKIR